jgi:hypothetical protein
MQRPTIVEFTDGSIVIEFIKNHKRFGISIETEGDESGWYYVTREESTGTMLPPDMIEALKKFIAE